MTDENFTMLLFPTRAKIRVNFEGSSDIGYTSKKSLCDRVNRVKAFLKLLLSALIIFSPTTLVPQSNAADPIFDPTRQFRVYISESDWFNYPSFLALRKTSISDSQNSETVLCSQWGKGECVPANENFRTTYFGTVVLPPCIEGSAEYCIEKLEFGSGDGYWQEMKFNRVIKGPTQDPIREIGYPGGSTISLFDSQNEEKKLNVDGYAVYASFEIYDTALSQKEPRFDGLDLRVTPYKLENGKFLEQSISTNIDSNGRKGLGFSSFGTGVVWSENNQRGKVVSFPKNIALRLSLRLPNTVTGWLGGRLAKAEVSVKRINTTANQLVIAGYPATVGIAESILDREKPPVFFEKRLKENPKSGGFGYRGSNGVFDVLSSIKDSINDRSVREETRWSINSYPNSTNQCLRDDSRLTGLVTTNATVFDAVPPTFQDGFLTYKVGGLHLDSQGGITSGQYDLVLRSDVARCLYKFTSAPIQASISISYESGEKQVSTQLISERDGWLYLGAYNFTFSSPIIKVKLFQDPPLPSPTPTSEVTATPPAKPSLASSSSKSVGDSPTPSPSQSALLSIEKKTSITCIKGKLTKRVSGINPKCPTGYKKK